MGSAPLELVEDFSTPVRVVALVRLASLATPLSLLPLRKDEVLPADVTVSVLDEDWELRPIIKPIVPTITVRAAGRIFAFI
jgi:hypothetical protein